MRFFRMATFMLEKEVARLNRRALWLRFAFSFLGRRGGVYEVVLGFDANYMVFGGLPYRKQDSLYAIAKVLYRIKNSSYGVIYLRCAYIPILLPS